MTFASAVKMGDVPSACRADSGAPCAICETTRSRPDSAAMNACAVLLLLEFAWNVKMTLAAIWSRRRSRRTSTTTVTGRLPRHLRFACPAGEFVRRILAPAWLCRSCRRSPHRDLSVEPHGSRLRLDVECICDGRIRDCPKNGVLPLATTPFGSQVVATP